MYDHWEECAQFPKYEVSTNGEVRSKLSLEIKTPFKNKGGCRFYNMYDPDSKRMFVKSAAVLVAMAYKDYPKDENHNTIIHLDGDKANCHPDNLEWHTRSFAIHYHREINYRHLVEDRTPILNTTTGARYLGINDAAQKLLQLPTTVQAALRYNDQCDLDQLGDTVNSFRLISDLQDHYIVTDK